MGYRALDVTISVFTLGHDLLFLQLLQLCLGDLLMLVACHLCECHNWVSFMLWQFLTMWSYVALDKTQAIS